jgi:hypothetical protein
MGRGTGFARRTAEANRRGGKRLMGKDQINGIGEVEKAATELRKQGRSQVKLGNEERRWRLFFLRQDQDDGI